MDDDVQALVSRFREATSTTPDDPTRRAIYRRVQARVLTGARPVATTTTPWVIAFAVAAALVLMWALADGLEAARIGVAPSHEQALDRALPRGPADATHVGAPIASPPLASTAAPPVVTIPEPPPLLRVSTASPTLPATGAPTAPTAVLAPDDALRRETELLEHARRAALAGDRDGAGAAIERHAREFPRGVLAPERWVLGIELACAAGAHERAARDAAMFFAAYPHANAARTLRERPCDRVTIETSHGQ